MLAPITTAFSCTLGEVFDAIWDEWEDDENWSESDLAEWLQSYPEIGESFLSQLLADEMQPPHRRHIAAAMLGLCGTENSWSVLRAAVLDDEDELIVLYADWAQWRINWNRKALDDLFDAMAVYAAKQIVKQAYWQPQLL